jgi:hypothetical protein
MTRDAHILRKRIKIAPSGENHTMSTPGINKQTSDVHIPNEEAVSLSSVVVFKMGEVHICSSTCLQ